MTITTFLITMISALTGTYLGNLLYTYWQNKIDTKRNQYLEKFIESKIAEGIRIFTDSFIAKLNT